MRYFPKYLLTALFLTIFILSYSVRAQDHHIIDSLSAVIEAEQHDTLVCDAYLIWGEEVYLSNPSTSLILFHKARKTAKRNLGTNLAVPIEKKYLWSLARSLNNIGAIYKTQGDIAKSLEYLHKALAIREEIGDKVGIAGSLSNIGYMYKDQGDTQKALKYYFQALKMGEEAGDKFAIGVRLNNIGLIYLDQGDSVAAFEYFHKSLKVKKENGYKLGMAISLNNIGIIYKNQNDLTRALEYFHQSVEIKEEMGDKSGIANSLNNIGDVYLRMGNIDKAKEYAQKSIQLSKKLGFPENIRNAAKLYSKVHKKQRNYKEALEMYELHIQMRDSIKNEETQKATIRQQTKYEFEKAQLIKEQEEKEQARIQSEQTSRRDNLQYSVVLICLLGIGILVAILGRLSLSVRLAEGIIFFAFLLFFEFILVLADPYIERFSAGAPAIKLAFNALLAGMIFPLHSLFESKMKKRLL